MPFCLKPSRIILALSCGIVFSVVVLLSGCGPRLDGSSENAIKRSYQQMKSTLGKTDTAKLTAAIKVIGFSILGAKMNNADADAGQSLDVLVRKNLDGKTYNAIINMAEDSLKAEKRREITGLQKEIAELQADMYQRKAAYDSLKSKLNAIQGRLVKIDLDKGTPTAYFEFKNVSGQELDHFTLTAVARSVSKKTVVVSSTQFYGGVKTLGHNDTLLLSLSVSTFDKSQAPEIPWSSITYPVTNAARYNISAEACATEIKLDDKDYDLNTVKWSDNEQDEYNKKYHDLKDELKEAQNRRENLDDI